MLPTRFLTGIKSAWATDESVTHPTGFVGSGLCYYTLRSAFHATSTMYNTTTFSYSVRQWQLNLKR